MYQTALDHSIKYLRVNTFFYLSYLKLLYSCFQFVSIVKSWLWQPIYPACSLPVELSLTAVMRNYIHAVTLSLYNTFRPLPAGSSSIKGRLIYLCMCCDPGALDLAGLWNTFSRSVALNIHHGTPTATRRRRTSFPDIVTTEGISSNLNVFYIYENILYSVC